MFILKVVTMSFPLVFCLLAAGSVAGDFGDYADHSFNCPATTTCPQVCVEFPEDCPSEMKCGEYEELCADGSCAPFCDPDLVSPCTSSCASVACPKIVATYDICQRNYSLYYEFANTCESMFEEVVDNVASLSWTHPVCLAVYAWVIGVSLGIVGWCWYK